MKDNVKVRGAYAISTISVTLVLFLIGSALHFYYNIKSATDSVVNNIKITMVLEDGATKDNIKEAKGILEDMDYVSKSEFVSKEQALKNFSEFIDDELIEVDGFNPLPASFDIYFAKIASVDLSAEAIQRKFEDKSYVDEFLFQTAEIDNLVENLKSVNIIMMFFGAVLMFISIMLIRDSIKANIFAKRFLIKTMLLIGATAWFIRRPFIGRAMLQGFLSSIFAYLMILVMMLFVKRATPLLEVISDLKLHLYVFGILAVLGVTLCAFLTNSIVGKYIRSKNDKLYSY